MSLAEITVLDGIQNIFKSGFRDTVFPIITLLGNAGIFWILFSLALVIIKKTRPLGIAMMLALILDVILCNGILKPLVARTRPYELNTAVQLLIKTPSDFSFPSGHTAASFAAASSLLYSKSKLWIPAMILAAVIAFSRLYLYVHFPTDILGGIIVGFICGYLGVLISKKLIAQYEMRHNHVEEV